MSNESKTKETSPVTFTIAKYLILLAIIGFVALTIRSKHQTSAPFEQVSTAVENAINKATMHDVGRKAFRRYYNLNEAEFEGILLYQSVSGMSADEILLVKVNSQEQAEQVRAAVESRRQARINDFGTYAPEESQTMENALILVEGEYVLFAATDQQDDIKKAFQESL